MDLLGTTPTPLSLGFMPQTSLSAPCQLVSGRCLPCPRLSLGFMPQTSLSALDALACKLPYDNLEVLSLGFMPQTSLSAARPRLCTRGLPPAFTPVSGVHAPDLVERWQPPILVPPSMACLWGLCPRLR